MKLAGELKKEVEKIETQEGKKEAVKKAGMELFDEEYDQVVGGTGAFESDNHTEEEGACTCPICGGPATKITHNGQVWGECVKHGGFSL